MLNVVFLIMRSLLRNVGVGSVAAVLLLGYVVIYAFLVELPPHRAYHMAPDAPERRPSYHGLPSVLFAPVHLLDRAWVRPDVWMGRIEMLEADVVRLSEEIEQERTQP
jgi:hypothetical protein